MASSVNMTTRVLADKSWSRGRREIKWVWRTEGADTGVSGGTCFNVTGRILGIKATPTIAADNYDVTITEEFNGLDVLNGAGQDLPADPTDPGNIRCPFDALKGADIPVMDEALTLNVANAGTNSSGVFILYVELP